MEIKKKSFFKNEAEDVAWFENWVVNLENSNNRKYDRLTINTSLGKTSVWGLHSDDESLDTLVIFPGARTTSLFWDFDKNLDNLGVKLRIFMVETNGLPNLSDGSTPDIKTLGYGEWASEVFDLLKIKQAWIAGASFGGLVCMKFAIVSPEKIKAVFLLNPGCLQSFSLTLKNLYYNILPIVAPSRKNILTFLEKAVLCKPSHALSADAEKLIIDYEQFALTRYKDNTQKPYYMDNQLTEVNTDTYLLVGDHDLLFPFTKSIENAKKQVKSLKDFRVFEQVGHGIETYAAALRYIGDTIKKGR